MFGKTIFNWNIPSIMNGNPNDFAKLIFDAGFEGVCLKGGEGNTIFKQRLLGPWPLWGENIRPELVTALRTYGLKVYIWHFLYGVDPKGELSVADKLCSTFQPDGYIWDAESIFDSKVNAVGNAKLLTTELKLLHRDIPQALCWWALPKNPEKLSIEWHPVKVGRAFLENVDLLMPMMYWGGVTASDAIIYLNRSLTVWDSIGQFPMSPIGRAYTGDAGYVDSRAIFTFAQKLKYFKESEGRDIRGCSWWVLDQAYKNVDAWTSLRLTPNYGQNFIDLSKLSMEEITKRLVMEHRYLFPEL